MKIALTRKAALKVTAAVIVLLLVIGLIVGLVFAFKDDKSPRLLKSAIVSNGAACAPIGQSILNLGGNAVDASIAILFCEGVILPHSMGIGGGFLATIYIKETGTVVSLNAREAAPLASTENMFVNITEITGAIAGAVPGELLGYWEMHKNYGKLDWKLLVEPTIRICKHGHPISKHMHNAMKQERASILAEPSLSEILMNPQTNDIYNEGDIITRPKLAETLREIADKGVDVFYNGTLGKMFIEDFRALGGLMTEQDLAEYTVKWSEPTKVVLQKDYQVYSSPLPGSGAVLSLIMNMMNRLLTPDRNLLWHRVIETFKHAYGQRTQLGDIDFEPSVVEIYNKLIDPNFAKQLVDLVLDDQTFDDLSYYGANFTNEEDMGTANMAVYHHNGDAVIVTSTINNYFGARVRSMSTGIILNDEMDDFSTPGLVNGFGIPPSPANFIKPKKRPLSSMCPTIVLDKNGDVQLLVGAAGGSKITTTVAQVIIRYLFLNEPLDDAVQTKRLHHQLMPKEVQHEYGYDQTILDSLQSKGHKLLSGKPESGFAALTAIGTRSIDPLPIFDHRRNGSTAVVYQQNKMFH